MSRLLSTLSRTTRTCVMALFLVPVAATAQDLKPNWQNLDLRADSVFGVSTERAYTELLKKRTSGRILVGVIDVGVDPDHEALRDIIWHNPKEIPGNGLDDDHNGYIDDVMGWAFLDPSDSEQSLPDSAAMRAAAGSAALGTVHMPGNADIKGAKPEHGTLVVGVIAARRDNNKLGVKGVADHVAVVVVRAIPYGDERDEHVALAIRYIVDAGAKVINMSFGKSTSPNKTLVDDAVKYAMSKDVLLVHAAGNDGQDEDLKGSTRVFPTKSYADGSGNAGAWIEVGASGPTNDSTLVPNFSNYGKTTVDVFAPGVNIRSTVPGGYEAESGTSVSAPVVTGIAALIRSQYPKLTALQVKDIIMHSVVKVDHDVMVGDRMRPFSDICVSGGVVNAYNALKLAATYK